MEIPNGFVKIPTWFLIAEYPAVVNIHLYMPANQKIIHFRKKGEILTLEDLLSLRAPGAFQIVTPQTEYEDAVKAQAALIVEGADEDGYIAEPAKAMANEVVKTMTTPEASRAALDEASSLARQIVTSLQSPDKAKAFKDILAHLAGTDPVATHNRHVAALSVLLMMAVGGFKMEDAADIAFAGFYHDLFLKDLPKMYYEKHLSGEELVLGTLKMQGFSVMSHIEMVLTKIKKERIPATANALKTIEEHHENYDGSGLKGLVGTKIYRPARILRIADDMTSLVNSPTHERSLRDAFFVLKKLNGQATRPIYDPELMRAIEAAIVKL